MGNIVPINEVKDYLLKIKLAIASGRYRFINRKKNLESMALAGLLPRHIKEVIKHASIWLAFNL